MTDPTKPKLPTLAEVLKDKAVAFKALSRRFPRKTDFKDTEQLIAFMNGQKWSEIGGQFGDLAKELAPYDALIASQAEEIERLKKKRYCGPIPPRPHLERIVRAVAELVRIAPDDDEGNMLKEVAVEAKQSANAMNAEIERLKAENAEDRWRYVADGELPEHGETVQWTSSYGRVFHGTLYKHTNMVWYGTTQYQLEDMRAWRPLPMPAPERNATS